VQQSRREHRRLEHEPGVGAHALTSDELGGHERPALIGVGAVGVQAREASGDTRHHEGTHHGAVAGELDRQMRDVGGEQRPRASRLDEAVGDEDHRQRGIGGVVPPAGHVHRVEAAGPQAVGKSVGFGEADVGRNLGLHGQRGGRARGERPADRGDESRRVGLVRAQGPGERQEHRVGDAFGQRVEQLFLPRGDVVDPHRPVGAELHAGIGAPQGRMRRRESEHAPIMPRCRMPRAGCPQARVTSRGIAALWRRR